MGEKKCSERFLDPVHEVKVTEIRCRDKAEERPFCTTSKITSSTFSKGKVKPDSNVLNQVSIRLDIF